MPELTLNQHTFELRYPAVMGILNLTPDSFSDGGAYSSVDAAVAQAFRMMEQGAQLIDLGGESTRPGSAAVSVEEELSRVMPVLEALPKDRCVISVDSNKLAVQQAVLEAGAHVINDVLGGSDELFALAEKHQTGLVLMHTSARPEVMQQHTQYDDVVADVQAYLKARADMVSGYRVPALWLDPGIGFGKTLEQNLALMQDVDAFRVEGAGVLLGASRKSWLAKLCGAEVDARLGGSLAAALYGATKGVELLRVHDVLETVQALEVWASLTR